MFLLTFRYRVLSRTGRFQILKLDFFSCRLANFTCFVRKFWPPVSVFRSERFISSISRQNAPFSSKIASANVLLNETLLVSNGVRHPRRPLSKLEGKRYRTPSFRPRNVIPSVKVAPFPRKLPRIPGRITPIKSCVTTSRHRTGDLPTAVCMKFACVLRWCDAKSTCLSFPAGVGRRPNPHETQVCGSPVALSKIRKTTFPFPFRALQTCSQSNFRSFKRKNCTFFGYGTRRNRGETSTVGMFRTSARWRHLSGAPQTDDRRGFFSNLKVYHRKPLWKQRRRTSLFDIYVRSPLPLQYVTIFFKMMILTFRATSVECAGN